MSAPKEAAFDFSFYAPYKAAVETAFLSLCAARMQLEEEHTPFAVRSMTFRLKSPASIREKLLRRGLPRRLHSLLFQRIGLIFLPQNAQGAASLHDVAGLRVVLSSVEAVYHFADILRASTAWQFVCARDYIAAPKKSGYRGLHLVMLVPVCLNGQNASVPVEIQLRTPAMDMWACVEHDLCYKPVKEA